MADVYVCPVCPRGWRGHDVDDLVEHAEREHGHDPHDDDCQCKVCLAGQEEVRDVR